MVQMNMHNNLNLMTNQGFFGAPPFNLQTYNMLYHMTYLEERATPTTPTTTP
jgi:hypothetical protein